MSFLYSWRPYRRSLSNVENRFMTGCSGPYHYPHAAFNVTHIGCAFLRDTSTLTEIDLSPLSNVTGIGHGFMCCCTSRTALDVGPLVNVVRVGNMILQGCTSLSPRLDLRLTETSLGWIPTSWGDAPPWKTWTSPPLKNVTHVEGRRGFMAGVSIQEMVPVEYIMTRFTPEMIEIHTGDTSKHTPPFPSSPCTCILQLSPCNVRAVCLICYCCICCLTYLFVAQRNNVYFKCNR